eukprot:4835607-Prorocentrum_lima.AAC.1
MTSFKQSAADWMAKKQNAWRTTFKKDLGGEQLCFSAGTPGGEQSKKHSLGWEMCCLDQTPCSTL